MLNFLKIEMKEYQNQEWLKVVSKAEKALEADCPLIEDEVIVAMNKDIEKMINFINNIANDYIESSHEKVRIQRDDYVRFAKKLQKELKE